MQWLHGSFRLHFILRRRQSSQERAGRRRLLNACRPTSEAGEIIQVDHVRSKQGAGKLEFAAGGKSEKKQTTDLDIPTWRYLQLQIVDLRVGIAGTPWRGLTPRQPIKSNKFTEPVQDW